MYDLTFKSPNNKYKVKLAYSNEIAFGPSFYKAYIGFIPIKGYFGNTCIWSRDSAYVALQEWLSTDRLEGPLTSLTIVDPIKNRILRTDKSIKGFIKPTEFIESKIIYKKTFYSIDRKENIEECEYLIIPTDKNWSSLYASIVNSIFQILD